MVSIVPSYPARSVSTLFFKARCSIFSRLFCHVTLLTSFLQVYISQIFVASALGAVVEAVGSVRVIPIVASVGSLLGFLTACFLVIYPAPNNG